MLICLTRLDKRTDIRMPITVDILKIIGELVVSSINRHDHVLQSNNIHFLEQINSLEICIPHYRTDQSGRGINAATTCSIKESAENKIAELGRLKSNSYKSDITVPSSELVQVSDLPNSIWIIESSIISRVFVRAKQSSFRKDLQLDGFNASV
ncbi:hypothetical protein KUTeg_012614 [Tegillarca granosa]|uniref:Uncharacterized protein n=1 Tax=Tegillarca granosa TaxID=220873 RepID=A0ABQ9EZZ3_TEGGR|nr:hypothetical protein KUTeg_012614 [Tegillarca granosa]